MDIYNRALIDLLYTCIPQPTYMYLKIHIRLEIPNLDTERALFKKLIVIDQFNNKV